jgi:hypothetical protein
MLVSFRIVTREWLGPALCNALELSIYGFLISLWLICSRSTTSECYRTWPLAEDMYAPAFIPGGIHTEILTAVHILETISA